MKVIHIASGDLWAGAEAQLYSLVCALHHTKGIDVEVILLNHGELEARLRRAGVSVTVFNERELSSLTVGWRVLRHVRRARPDIVHTHRHKENVLGSIAARLAGVGSLRSAHGRDEAAIPGWRLDKRLYRLLDQLCGRWLQQRVVAVSAQLAKELVTYFPGEQITVIENGVDIAGVLLAAATGAELPGQPGRIRVGFVSRLVSVKRIDLFLQTAHKLHRGKPGMFDFYIVGDGPQYDLCRQLIAQLDLVDCAHMLGFRADVAAVLAGMDLLLITSDHEGLPMTLLEAMSLEVPVVASAVGGIPQALGHGQCGRLVHAQQAKAYVAAVLELLADPVSRRKLVQHALDRVRDYYSAERSAADYVNLYRQLCPDKAEAYQGKAASPAGTMRG